MNSVRNSKMVIDNPPQADMLARYVENLINKKNEKSGITREFLLEKGFL